MLRRNVSPRTEAVALFFSHGVADGVSTVIAASVLGHGHEANPLMRALLASHWTLALGVMVGLSAVGASLWYVVAYSSAHDDRWPGWSRHVVVSFSGLLTGVGVYVTASNLFLVASVL